MYVQAGIKLTRILAQNLSLYAFIAVATMDCSVAKSRGDAVLPANLSFTAVRSSQEPQSDERVFSQLLLSGADNFSPKLRTSGDDTPVRVVPGPDELLGWPQLSDLEKKRRQDRIDQANAENDLKKLRAQDLERRTREQIEDLNRKFLERQQQRKQDLKRKAEEAARQAKLREEKLRAEQEKRAQQERLKKQKDQEQLEAQRQKQAAQDRREAEKRQAKEAKKQQQDAIKAQKKQEQDQKQADHKKVKEQKKLAAKKKPKDDGPPWITPKTTTIDFSRAANNSGQVTQQIDTNTVFELFNKDTITVNTGHNTYEQSTAKTVQNIPLRFAWETKVGQEAKFTLTTGIEWFDRVPTAPTFTATYETPIKIPKQLGQELLGTIEIDYGPYKFNAETIQNQIRYLRLRGSLAWQIDNDTTFSTVDYAGILNDGNQELQSFNRIERKLGDFTLAGNLFYWRFNKDLSKPSGYFAPQMFLVYSLEAAWEGMVIKPLSCRLSATLGQQLVNGKSSNASSLQALCTVPITKDVALDFGYALSNVFTGGQVSQGNALTNTFTSQLKINW